MSNELIKRIISSLVLIPLSLFFIIKGSILFVLFISLCFILISIEWHNMAKKKSYYFFGYLFLFFSFYSIYNLRNHFDGEYMYLLLITSICVFTDIGGYTFGKLFKGPKLTQLSPNKTYSGMIGSYILSILAILVILNYNFILDNSAETNLSSIIFVFIISTISQIGDIIISYFKRIANIKDTGKILPGHGGLLDRVDGMIFAFPFSFVILSITDYQFF